MAKINYKAILDKAWTQHLEPKAHDAPTVISLFAGCGGSSLGYSMAGFRELLAVEWDDHAAAMFKLNFPEVRLFHGDIAKLTDERCFELTGFKSGELDVLDGSPPCQGFSTSGHRKMHDERNQLFREYVRILNATRPRVFVMENVSGMVKGKMKLIFAEIMRELKKNGYKVSARLLDASYFEVPQMRQRLIFVGMRNDVEVEPSHPAPISNQICLRDAIQDADISCTDKVYKKAAENYHLIPFGKSLKDALGGTAFFSTIKPNPNKPCNTICKQGGGRVFGVALFRIAHVEHWRSKAHSKFSRSIYFDRQLQRPMGQDRKLCSTTFDACNRKSHQNQFASKHGQVM